MLNPYIVMQYAGIVIAAGLCTWALYQLVKRSPAPSNCPMCNDNPSWDGGICGDCEAYCNAPYVTVEPTVEEQHYQMYVERFGEDHPETIRVGSFLGLL